MIYLDESGISAGEPYLVVAGAIIHADKQWIAIERHLRDMVEALIPPEMRDGFSFHATDLFHGTRKFHRDKWPKERRWKILDELVSIPQKFDLPLVVGFINKADVQQAHSEAMKDVRSVAVGAQAIGLMLCAIAAERWFKTKAAPDEVGVLIAEDNRDARALMRHVINFNRNPKLVAQLPDETRKELPFTKIVDTIHFAEKLDSSPLQIADAVAFATMRRLRRARDSDRFYAPIEPNLVAKPNLAKLDLIDLTGAASPSAARSSET